jgi:hypothetical protein
MYSAPATPQYAYAPPMPAFEKGGRVKETYGLENAAEMIRRQGREGDTVLAHISPQEAGVLKLLGGSGTINPHTGLPEFKSIRQYLKSTPVVRDIYKVGSKIGKEIEGGIESIARNKILGPIAQMASYLHPVSAALYAGLSPEGSSFDIKGAAKAAALQQIGQGVKEYMAGAPQTGSDAFMGGVNERGGSYLAASSSAPTGVPDFVGGITERGGSYLAASPEIGALESAVSPIPYTPDPSSYVSGASAVDSAYASAPQTTLTDAAPAPAPAPTPAPTLDMSGFEGGVTERGGSYTPDYNLPPVVDRSVPLTDVSGVRGLDPAGENYLGAAGSLAEGAYDLAASNPMTTAAVAYGGYTAYQTKKELDDAKEEAERILRDQANKKAEEIAWAQGVLRDYPYNYRRLTEEDVRRERGMAMGGRINSYDDEMGSDDGMMQGGIAALAKGGLPPRYLRGGGDGMSDSIKANIDGKQEARLADGEFVVPADVVSHLGNGSSNAGAKRLYEMMNRVRKSRTGKTRQAPEVNTRKMLPV